MSETEVQALTLTKQLFDDDRLAKLIRNPRGWRGCSPKATTVSFQDRLKAYEDENQDAAWEIKIANAKEEAEKQTRQKDDPDQALSDRLEIGFMVGFDISRTLAQDIWLNCGTLPHYEIRKHTPDSCQ
ncbi:hypothetical protein LTR47_007821 [Exophiala xenobiotica]|nr:hypothetical protein LTR41_005305 [Exophiala xenobiotica]KAK5221165.1 hypothetical protein LTR72_006725 [Exophiala xenobiotica]KAK5229219.1 hypothetical protein LTR47_007821 [Exophiala xenobiotica]KAK5248253.1 hypothetical protein LTS06_006685 [Exophiala xenobiotica]KAK5261182.1 hypothetical protein LTR40_002722 [Exophiala xenobiotica]